MAVSTLSAGFPSVVTVVAVIVFGNSPKAASSTEPVTMKRMGSDAVLVGTVPRSHTSVPVVGWAKG